jgi:hypothetical protein
MRKLHIRWGMKEELGWAKCDPWRQFLSFYTKAGILYSSVLRSASSASTQHWANTDVLICLFYLWVPFQQQMFLAVLWCVLPPLTFGHTHRYVMLEWIFDNRATFLRHTQACHITRTRGRVSSNPDRTMVSRRNVVHYNCTIQIDQVKIKLIKTTSNACHDDTGWNVGKATLTLYLSSRRRWMGSLTICGERVQGTHRREDRMTSEQGWALQTSECNQTSATFTFLTNQPTNRPTTQPNNQPTHSTDKSPFWEANTSAASQKFPALYETQKFITQFTTARHQSLSWAQDIQCTFPTNVSCKISVNIVHLFSYIGPFRR